MKLATKIILGFSSLIMIAVSLGVLAVWKMAGVRNGAAALDKEYMPASAVANEIERQSLRSMYAMRGYSYSEEAGFFADAQRSLAEVHQRLEEARTLAARDGNRDLAFLRESIEKAEARAKEYGQLAGETESVTASLQKERVQMDVEAQNYMKACEGFLESQNTRLNELLNATNSGTAINTDTVKERVLKINLANAIIEAGNGIRVGNFKSQATRNPELFRETLKKFPDVYARLDSLEGITQLEVDLKRIEACRAAAKAYEGAMDQFLKNWLAREDLGARRNATADAVLAECQATAQTSIERSSQTASAAATALTAASRTIVAGLCVALLAGAAMAFFITRSIAKPIRAVASQLADGASQTVSAAQQVSASSQSLAEGSSEQAASIEETGASLEEMSATTLRNAENASRANALAKEARLAAERGSADMQAMTSAMEAIKSSSDDIAKIIKTIDEIAFQTNILALNAAVEAARAGEAGMGFAVVADEVRSLAQRSAQAAKETTAKIESAISKTSQGVDISAKVASALRDIFAKARQVDELAAEVAGASREQTQGIGQINSAVGQMDKVTQSNAANAEESAAAAEELNAQAQSMNQAVQQLLRLVDGVGSLAAAPAPASAESARQPRTLLTQSPKRVPSAAPALKTNGHTPLPAAEVPGPALVADRRREIPLEESFRDF